MPNWCENDLRVKGPTEEVTRFVEFVQGLGVEYQQTECEKRYYAQCFARMTPEARLLAEVADLSVFDFNQLVPVPEAIQQQPYDPAGYNWQNQHWGTKWNACDAAIRGQGTYKSNPTKGWVLYYLETAWSPPLPVIMAAIEQFPQLEFILRFYEAGMQFKGVLQGKNGQIIKDEHAKYTGRRGG